ncbi:MAG: phospho-N-acetylmuramoyl-pentapeptide-transferase [Phascolarctobacterium sp.]|uniref:phospho-N-acetylmuramoyl-pentapeptide- transferase n=1 Tax=Phascolarctobacterium sp. TaxID=2049039 RepID=UPI0026DAB8C9|nr:phospho-N-acetylmuramoyl-pentapeptide-transferase [Phascolarctobacterium sp.]MDO4922083.1 phospho-N-acetylmuramoyl-pentapeptide-transferase [Phascolarctobacterium sp.]
MFKLVAIPVTAFIVCALIGPVLIKYLHKLNFGQSIRECGPASHMKKSGTPTMGGLMMLAALALALLWGSFTPRVVIALVLTLGHGAIGFIDDYIKVVMKRNLGLTAKQKFLLQFILAGAYVYFAETHIGNTELWVPGLNVTLDFGWGYYALAFVLLVGTTNAVNLTDGLDGLVSFVSLPVTLAFAFIAYMQGLLDLSGFALGMAGACLGFLLFNRHPAQVFMGDTGSLALGGGVAALALLTRTELLLVIIGGVYVAEALSVIIQVGYFRLTGGKRFFRMAPVHHHFELGGWREVKVVRVFTIFSLALSAAGLWLWLTAVL